MITALDHPERAEDLAEMLKAVAHPIRLRIIGALCAQPCTVTELWQGLDIRQSLVSQHLGVLRMQGLVQADRTGGNATYSLKEERLKGLVECINGCRRRE